MRNQRFRSIDFVITVCGHARERCLVFVANAKKLYQGFADPAKAIGTEEEIKQKFRDVRNFIKGFLWSVINNAPLLGNRSEPFRHFEIPQIGKSWAKSVTRLDQIGMVDAPYR
ncbi:MAG TPA: hypothetical protein VGB84_09235 [Arachidicoccus sp.]